jgi:hypothetical protein
LTPWRFARVSRLVERNEECARTSWPVHDRHARRTLKPLRDAGAPAPAGGMRREAARQDQSLARRLRCRRDERAVTASTLLRQYFPKGTDLPRWSAEVHRAVALAVNNQPRKVLGWKRPAEVFAERLLARSNPVLPRPAELAPSRCRWRRRTEEIRGDNDRRSLHDARGRPAAEAEAHRR